MVPAGLNCEGARLGSVQNMNMRQGVAKQQLIAKELVGRDSMQQVCVCEERSRHEIFSRGVNTPPKRDLKTCVCTSLRERVTCMCADIGSSRGSRVFIQKLSGSSNG